MPLWLLIVLIVLLVLAVGGAIARRRQLDRTRDRFERALAKVDRDLAAAAAQDRGWDRERLEAAARRVAAERLGAEPEELVLVEVIDRPGIEEDQAVFRVGAAGDRQRVVLGRRGEEWVAADR
ncbi:MAG TPA: hypothetical protein VH418_05505 [Solirubrobacteraceae bacterium]|jgi:hypothetical protein